MSFQDEIAEQAMRGINPSDNETLQEVLRRRFSRRQMLKSAAWAVPALVLSPALLAPGKAAAAVRGRSAGAGPGALRFKPINLSLADRVEVPEDYAYDVLLRWGDAILPDAPDFDLDDQSRASQERQFGFNCDYTGFFPLPRYGAGTPGHGMLAVNHEYTNPRLMFPGYVVGSPSRTHVDAEIAAHGVSFVEIRKDDDGRWSYLRESPRNRRLTGETRCEIRGPAAGHPLMRTSADPQGRTVRGTLNNCAGGKTPWGTLLTCEENFNQYFAHRESLPEGAVRDAHDRYGLPGEATRRRWEAYHERFDLKKEPHEPFRFGWVVEIDPYDPQSTPKKRTALGRFKHEGATTVVARDGRVVVYSGDDERFDYIYKFVTARAFNPKDRTANADLLDEGTLYVAKFHDDGTGEWLPLVHGEGPLTAEHGFTDQGEVLIKARLAADAVGATKMDRPEDIEASPVTGKVYSVMTNNTARTPDQVNAANPRPHNVWGHVIEQTEAGGDHAATTFTWEIFIQCGDPAVPEHEAYFAGYDKEQVSPISSPDNLAFDHAGHCWIATDGLSSGLEGNDGLFAVPVEGPERGYLRQFMSAPPGAEVCGPEFNPDFTTLFLAIQHPGDGSRSMAREDLTSTWPDGGVPRPSVIAIRKKSGPGKIGS